VGFTLPVHLIRRGEKKMRSVDPSKKKLEPPVVSYTPTWPVKIIERKTFHAVSRVNQLVRLW